MFDLGNRPALPVVLMSNLLFLPWQRSWLASHVYLGRLGLGSVEQPHQTLWRRATAPTMLWQGCTSCDRTVNPCHERAKLNRTSSTSICSPFKHGWHRRHLQLPPHLCTVLCMIQKNNVWHTHIQTRMSIRANTTHITVNCVCLTMVMFELINTDVQHQNTWKQ